MNFKCDKYKKLNVLTEDGGYIEFRKGEYKTTDKKEISILNKILDVIIIDETEKKE